MEEIKFQVADSYVHYVKAGNGPKNLVIVSGVSLCGFEGFGGSIAKQYKVMLDDYTLYFFDRRRDITSDIRIADLADDIYKALQNAGVTHAQFIGFSQGGMISLQLAVSHPEMMDSLIIGSSTAGPYPEIAECGKRWAAPLAKDDIYDFNLVFYKDLYSPEYYAKFERAFEKLAHRGTPEQARRFEKMLKAMDSFDLKQGLSEIKCPCYVVVGEKDKVMGTKPSLDMAKALGCECYIYPGGSHAFNDEDKTFPNKLYEILKSLEN